MVSRRSFLPVAVLPLIAWAGCIDVSGADSGKFQQHEEKRFTVQGKPEVVLSTFDGSIEIRSWDNPDVSVTIEKRAATQAQAAALEVESTQNGNRVTVEVKHSRNVWSWFGPGSARLIVSVPQAADVRATSGDGAISLDRVNGTLSLRSGDGRIQATNSSGRVSVATGDGSIDLNGVDGAIEATTGDGRVRIAGKLSGVHARSGDGSIAIQAQPGSSAEADWDITSGDGAITLQIPDGFNAELDARTGDGGIHLEGVNVTTSGTITRNTVAGRLGSGGRALRVRTGDGSITLRRPQT